MTIATISNALASIFQYFLSLNFYQLFFKSKFLNYFCFFYSKLPHMFILLSIQTITALTFIGTTIPRFVARTIKSEAIGFFTKTSIQRYYFSLLCFLLFYIVFEVAGLLITVDILPKHIYSIILFRLDLISCFFCKLTLFFNLFFRMS